MNGIKRLCAGLCAAMLIGLTACGGGGGSGSDGSPAPAPKLASINVTTPQAPISSSSSAQLTAKAVYSDGSTLDISSQANWTSSDTAVVQLGTGATANVASTLQEGTATVTATFQGLSGTANIQVGTPIRLIEIFSLQHDKQTIATGGSIRYAVYATFQSNGRHEATRSAVWQSSDPSVALVSKSDGENLIRGLKPGKISLTVSLYGMSMQVPLTVTTTATLGYHLGGSGFENGKIALSTAENAMAVWSDPFSGDLFNTPAFIYLSAYTGSTGWSGTDTAASIPTPRGAQHVAVAANQNGTFVRAWSSPTGVFATRQIPGRDWETPQQVASSDPNFDQADSLQLVVDATGNAVLVGRLLNGQSIFSSTLKAGETIWSATTRISASDAASLPRNSLTINNRGQVALVWIERISVIDTASTAYASIFDFENGWSNPTSIFSADCSNNPHIAINDLGDMIVSNFNRCQVNSKPAVYVRRYSHVDGWMAQETIVSDVNVQAASAMVGINNDAEAVLVWGSDYDGAIFAHHFAPATGWTAAKQLTAPQLYRGTPVVYPPAVADDGRFLALWVSGTMLSGMSTYSRALGWQPEKPISIMGFKFAVNNASFAFDRKGNGLVVWNEYYSDAEGKFQDIYSDKISF